MYLGVLDLLRQGIRLDNFMPEVGATKFYLMCNESLERVLLLIELSLQLLLLGCHHLAWQYHTW